MHHGRNIYQYWQLLHTSQVHCLPIQHTVLPKLVTVCPYIAMYKTPIDSRLTLFFYTRSSAGAGHKSSSKNAAAVKKRTEGFMNTRGKLKLVVDDTSSFGDGRSDASSSGIDRKGAPPPKRDIGGVAFAHSGYCPISVRVALSAVDGYVSRVSQIQARRFYRPYVTSTPVSFNGSTGTRNVTSYHG